MSIDACEFIAVEIGLRGLLDFPERSVRLIATAVFAFEVFKLFTHDG